MQIKTHHKKKLLYISILFFSLVLSCRNRILTDPFWEINLKSDISVINNELYKKSKEGEITDCVFSFDRVIYIKNKDFDARINASLDLPKIINDNLKIDYTIVTQFKHVEEQRFNPAFYSYFVGLMEESYGAEVQKEYDKNKILLLWADNNKLKVKVSVLKDINLYMVSIEKRI